MLDVVFRAWIGAVVSCRLGIMLLPGMKMGFAEIRALHTACHTGNLEE
jgi:hypothetical protein